MFITSRITGTGSYLPPRAVTNEEAGSATRLSASAVKRLTGISMRYWADSRQASSDLAEQAGRDACEAAGVEPSSIETVIVSTTSPDMVFPSTACLLQARLGIKGAAAFDVSASCSGFLYGLSMADRFIRAGQSRRCLVVASEIKSRFLDHRNEATAVIFGDGAGAAVVQAVENSDSDSRILGVRLFADGRAHGMIGIPAGGSRRPTTAETLMRGEHVLRMQGRLLFRMAVTRLTRAVDDVLKEFGCTVKDVSHAIFHQANARLLAAVARRTALPHDKLYSIIDRVGNTSSASLPIALDMASREGRLRRGDLVLLGTFGGGATWATGLVRW